MGHMKTQLRKLWESRSPRERSIITVFSMALGIILYMAIVLSAAQARRPLRAQVAMLRSQAAYLEQQTLEYERLRLVAGVTASSTNLHTLVQTRIETAGLSSSLLRIDNLNEDQVVVVFGAVAFADWLALIDGLQTQKIRLDTCRIEALSASGLVNVTGTLSRTRTVSP
jgi:type II secretory pathway component PulM